MEDLSLLIEGMAYSHQLASAGEYQSALSSYNQHLNLIHNLSSKVTASVYTKLMEAKNNIEAEMKLIREILDELSLLSRPISVPSSVDALGTRDPDVWAPPSPKHDEGNQAPRYSRQRSQEAKKRRS